MFISIFKFVSAVVMYVYVKYMLLCCNPNTAFLAHWIGEAFGLLAIMLMPVSAGAYGVGKGCKMMCDITKIISASITGQYQWIR